MRVLRKTRHFYWVWDENRLFKLPIIAGGHDTPTMDQEDFRWGNSDGNEAGHTFAAALNTHLTGVSLDSGNVRRILRIVIRETAGNANANVTGTIESDLNTSGTWEAVTGTENGDGVFCIAVNLTDTGDSTQRVGGGTFVTPNAGQTTDGSWGSGAVLDFVGSDETEIVIELEFNAATLGDTDSVRFRIPGVDTTSGPDANGFPSITFTKTAPATKNYYSGGSSMAQRLTRGIGWVQ